MYSLSGGLYSSDFFYEYIINQCICKKKFKNLAPVLISQISETLGLSQGILFSYHIIHFLLCYKRIKMQCFRVSVIILRVNQSPKSGEFKKKWRFVGHQFRALYFFFHFCLSKRCSQLPRQIIPATTVKCVG